MPLNLAAEASISLLFKFGRVRRGHDPALQCMTIGIPNCSINRNLSSAIYSDGFPDEGGSAGGVLVDIAPKALVRHIHLPQACQDLPGAAVVIAGNMRLQLLNQRLGGVGI